MVRRLKQFPLAAQVSPHNLLRLQSAGSIFFDFPSSLSDARFKAAVISGEEMSRAIRMQSLIICKTGGFSRIGAGPKKSSQSYETKRSLCILLDFEAILIEFASTKKNSFPIHPYVERWDLRYSMKHL